MRTQVALLAIALLSGCPDAPPEGASLEVALRAPADPLLFPRVVIGDVSSIDAVVLVNRSRVDATYDVEVTGPFEAPSGGELPAGASVPLHLVFRPTEIGAVEGQLTVRVEQQALTLTLSGEALPPCTHDNPCRQSVIDPATGACVAVDAAEGAACASDCVHDGVCVSGDCKGTTVDCADADACTADVCAPGSGCLHYAVTCEAPDDPCLSPMCDPKTGCAFAPAPDGTRCGSNDCTTAHVCIAGTCVTRSAPEGSACGDPSPCQPFGTCAAGVCDRPAPEALTLAWSYAPPSAVMPALLADDEAIYFVEGAFDAEAQVTARTLVSLTADTGALRFRTPLHDDVPAGGAPSLGAGLFFDLNGYDTVDAYLTATGARAWHLPLLPAVAAQLTPWNGYPNVRVEPLLVRAEGSDVAIYAQGLAMKGESQGLGFKYAGAFRIVVRPSNGALRSTQRLGEAFDPESIPVRDAQGRTWASIATRVDDGTLGYEVHAFDPAGGALWHGVPLGEDAAIGPAVGGQFFGWQRARSNQVPAPLFALDPATGDILRELPFMYWGGDEGTFVGRDTRVWTVAAELLASSLLDPEWHCCATMFLDEVDTAAGTWTSTPWPVEAWRSPLILTARDEALVAHGDAHYGKTGSNDWIASRAALTAIGPTGAGFECAIDAHTSAVDDPVLAAQRWIAFNRVTNEFVAYEVPGVEASSSGWVSRCGSFARDFAEVR